MTVTAGTGVFLLEGWSMFESWRRGGGGSSISVRNPLPLILIRVGPLLPPNS